MVRFARGLPAMRERVDADLRSGDLTREQVLACAVRLLDKGFFRIGSEDYAVTNETYGLATMRKDHVRLLEDGALLFDYPAKHASAGAVDDRADAAAIVKRLKARRGACPSCSPTAAGARGSTSARPTSTSTSRTSRASTSRQGLPPWNATVLAAVAWRSAA
jgi:hypothetical protein